MRIRDLLYHACLLTVSALLFTHLATAQPEWPATVIESGFVPINCQSFDADGVGSDDVVYLNACTGSVESYHWHEGQWTQSTLCQQDAIACSMVSGDLDSDGDMDLVVCDNYYGLFWLERDGDDWIQHFIVEQFWYNARLSIFDMDGDGDADICVYRQNECMFEWWSNELPEWTLYDIGQPPLAPHFFTTDDLDNDGDGDIVISEQSSNYWMEQTVDGWDYHDITVTFEKGAVATGDLNSDGWVDLVMLANNSALCWFENTQVGWEMHGLDFEATLLKQLQTIDLDADGDLDIVAGQRYQSMNVLWFENDGSGEFTIHYIVAGFDDFNSFSAGDVNDDGFLDIAVASNDNGLVCYLSDGLTSWNRTDVRRSYAGSTVLASADFDGDGAVEFVSNYGQVELGEWNPEGDEWTYTIIADGDYAMSIGFIQGDFNLNGVQDVLTAEFGIRPLRCWEIVDEEWTTVLTINTDLYWIETIQAADLDNDGETDLVAGGYNGLSWFEYRYGVFVEHRIVDEYDYWIEDIATADVDEDGNLNLITIQYEGDLRIWTLEDDVWSSDIIGYTGAQGATVIAGNFDADNDIELLTGSVESVLLWNQRSDGSWASHPAFDGVESASDFDMTDLDGDGWQDIVVTGAGSVYRAEQNANGWSASEQVYHTISGGAIKSAVADVDNDSDNDIITAYNLYGLVWLENMGDTFVAHKPATSTLPHTSVLYPCHPNPFNPTTQLTLALPSPGHASLVVYDATGREVVCLLDGELSAGTHRAMFDGTGLASGVYFATLTGPDAQVQTQKLVLVK